MTIKFKAKLTKIEGRMQCYEAQEKVPEHLKVIWLTGIDVAPGVQVGDVGTLEYHIAATRGYYAFTKA